MENVESRLSEIYGNRKWILVNTIAAGMPKAVKMFEDWGSEVMVIAASPGIGELPDAPITYTGTRGTSILDSIRQLLSSLAIPSEEVAEAVGEFDPDGEAAVILPLFADDPDVLSRRAYGVRPTSWTALEDKIEVISIWDEAGVRTAPHRVTTLKDAARVADEVGGDLGTVWVADNRDGWHGGAEYLRWVSTPAAYDESVRWFETRAHRVRVMPFLEGIPCSIHGWVGSTHTAAFRPVEILVFRTPERRFKYAGVSTRWDPPAVLAEDMREIARSVGRVLRDRVDYRGPFGIDGIATSGGFLPTELNPRFSGGFGLQTTHLDLPLGSILRAVVEGDLEVDAAELETEVLDPAHRKRLIRSWIEIPREYDRARTAIRFDQSREALPAEDTEDVDGTIELGPTPSGSIVMVELDPEKVGVGEPAAPLIAECARLATELWGLDLPELIPAEEVGLSCGEEPR